MRNIKNIILFFFCQMLLLTANAQQLPTVNVTTKTNPSNGYIFLASLGAGFSGIYYLLILDKEGRIIYAKSFPSYMNGSLLDFKPQPNNKYSFFDAKQSQYYILDKYFNIIKTVKAKNGYSTNNHELIMSDDDKYYLIADEVRTIDMSSIVYGGQTNAQVTGNIIQGIDANDSLIFEWKVLDHIPITDHVGDLTAPSIDFSHTNSLFLDTDTTLLLCNPLLNEITKINLVTADIIWRFGLKAHSNQFTFVNDSLGFIFQHYVNRLHNGNITLFDNGHGRFARAVEYEIDELNKTAKLVFQYRHSPDIYGPSMGSMNRISNGNSFICWGSANKMTEVDTAGNRVFEASFPNCTYRALKYDIPNPISCLIYGQSEICEGQTTIYSAIYDTNCTYSWSVTNGVIVSGQGTNMINVKWSVNGQGTVKLTKINSLNFKDYFFIYVKILPKPKAYLGVVQSCNKVRFINSTAGTVTTFWEFGDGDTSTLSDVYHFYQSSGTFLAKLKVTNNIGCSDSSYRTIVISDTPIANFSIDTVVCVNEKITLINRSINADSYFWDFDNSMNSNLKNPSMFSFSAEGIYNVKLVVSSSGCKDSLIIPVTVNANPIAQFSYNETCKSARFINSTSDIINQFWDFGDSITSILKEPEHFYNSPGSYQVRLSVINNKSCTDSITKTVIIPEEPDADFDYDSVVCVNEKTTIINKSNFADSFFWFMEDSIISFLKNPMFFTYPEPGSYNLKLIVTGSSCIDSVTKKVVVNPNPKSEFSFSEFCKGARFFNSSVNILNQFWDFGDGCTSILNDPEHIYDAPGSYQVRLKVINNLNCPDSSKQTVIIANTPKAEFSTDSLYCVDETISIINTSKYASSYFWDFANSHNSVLKNPVPFSYKTAGSYQIKMIASDSACSDSIFKTIKIVENPIVKFWSTMLTDSTIQFWDSSIISDDCIISWHWDFGDGHTSTLRNPLHIYKSPGTFSVKLCVTSVAGCEVCDSKLIIIKETGIKYSAFDNLASIYPSPSEGIFTIRSSETLHYIEICDAFGKVIMHVKPDTEIVVIDFDNEPEGIYIVKLRLKNHNQTIRIVKI